MVINVKVPYSALGFGGLQIEYTLLVTKNGCEKLYPQQRELLYAVMKKRWMMQDLRLFMGACEKKLPEEFVRIVKEVDPKYEITAIVKKTDLLGKSPMMVFDFVKGSAMSVVCNTDTDPNSFALALDVTRDFLPEAGWFHGFIQLDKKQAG